MYFLSDFILYKNAPALTHLLRICRSRFWHTVVFWRHSVMSTDVMTSRSIPIWNFVSVCKAVWPWENWQTGTDGNTGLILLPWLLTRQVIITNLRPVYKFVMISFHVINLCDRMIMITCGHREGVHSSFWIHVSQTREGLSVWRSEWRI